MNATQTRRNNLACAQQIRLVARQGPLEQPPSNTNTAENGEAGGESSGDLDIEYTRWGGGVLHSMSSDDKLIIVSDGDCNGDSDSGEEVEELPERPEVVTKYQKTLEPTLWLGVRPDPYSEIMC